MGMGALTSGLIAAPLLAMPVGEDSPFHFPGAEDFRIQHIARSGAEQGWPFSVDEGWLMCAWIMAEKAVYFAEMLPDDADYDATPRMVIVATDPLALLIVNVGANDLFAPFGGQLEQLIPLLAPFERLGHKLCDQPPGTVIGPGEL
jgi:hypothetical protein